MQVEGADACLRASQQAEQRERQHHGGHGAWKSKKEATERVTASEAVPPN